MPDLQLTPDEVAFLNERISLFDREVAQLLDWQCPYVREHSALPLYIGWTETLAIRPNGALVRWSTEGEWVGVREVDDPIWYNLALVQGARKYPELMRLVPKRPPSATVCTTCNGVGSLEALPDMICECGGTGWLPPGRLALSKR